MPDFKGNIALEKSVAVKKVESINKCAVPREYGTERSKEARVERVSKWLGRFFQGVFESYKRKWDSADIHRVM